MGYVALSHGMILGEIGIYSRMIINRTIILFVQLRIIPYYVLDKLGFLMF